MATIIDMYWTIINWKREGILSCVQNCVMVITHYLNNNEIVSVESYVPVLCQKMRYSDCIIMSVGNSFIKNWQCDGNAIEDLVKKCFWWLL